MADKESQKKGAIKPSTLLKTGGAKDGEGKDNPTAGLAKKLFAVETQAVKDYGVYSSPDYAGWRKRNNLSNTSGVSEKANKLQKQLASKNVSMSDINAANAFIKKWHTPLVGLDKAEAKSFKEESAKAKRKMPFSSPMALVNVAGRKAREAARK